MVFWGNSLSLRRWNRPESDPHLAAIVNATFKHSLLLSLSPFVPKPFSGTAKGLISSATNNPSHGGIDSFQSPYYAIVSAFPTYHYQFIIPSFSVSPSSFSIPLDFYHQNYEICFLFSVSVFSWLLCYLSCSIFFLFYFGRFVSPVDLFFYLFILFRFYTSLRYWMLLSIVRFWPKKWKTDDLFLRRIDF